MRRLFEQAIALPEVERADFARRTCEGDPELLRGLSELLAHDAQEGEYMEPPRDAFPAGAPERSDRDPGGRIGPYQIERLLGRGGMGTVHLARRIDEQFEKRVAIKLLKRGMDTDDVLNRFRIERQVLADLEHENIARLLDGGATDGGLPYLVMELVEGQPIGTFCDERRMDVRGRLELFVSVCEAVHFAHQHGVVHRDLKPGNILVTDEGQPKLLDFGIAKLVEEGESSSTIDITVTEQRMMTPEYASPEQVRGGKVSAATDVYSLGVILFELLTGHRPYRLSIRSSADVERIVCEESPPPPSTIVSRALVLEGRPSTPPETLSQRRGTETRRLRAQLEGDLDTICLMALRKEPDRRYATALDLADDIKRYASGRPVLARPDTWRYRTGKFIRRNNRLVGAVAAVVLALLAGLIVAEIGRRQANRQRDNVLRLSAAMELEALEEQARQLWPAHPERLQDFDAWVLRAEELVAGLHARKGDPGHIARLEELRSRALPGEEENSETASGAASPTERRFARDEDRWWHSQLEALVADIEAFADPSSGLIQGLSEKWGWGVARRRTWAREIEERSQKGPQASALWDAAIASIADPEQCSAYAGLRIEPQLGLLPIDRDTHSGLWEFAHLQTGEVPTRTGTGELVVTEQTGLVFVLVPGGTFWMGAQKEDPTAPNFDPAAAEDEWPAHSVSLSPFLISKYEMTQGQWLRIACVNPSSLYPGTRGGGSLLNPVERVSWAESLRLMELLGLTIPSEAQWEYAARAGTSWPWWTGEDRESLRQWDAVNLADRSAAQGGMTWIDIQDWPELDDGSPTHSAVTAYAPNPLGLHNVHGNVWEWCLDTYDPAYYGRSPSVEPLCTSGVSGNHVYRGGSFYKAAFFARSALRMDDPPGYIDFDIGLRPARKLTKSSIPEGGR